MSVVSPNLRTRIRGIATPIALAMGKVGLTPNALTLIGLCAAATIDPEQLTRIVAGDSSQR